MLKEDNNNKKILGEKFAKSPENLERRKKIRGVGIERIYIKKVVG